MAPWIPWIDRNKKKEVFSIKFHIFQYFAYKPILGSFKLGFDPLEF